MVKKKTLADFRREVDAINKATAPQSIGKTPAPFLGSGSTKKGTGSAMRKGVSSFDVSPTGVKDNLAPSPSQPAEPQDFPLFSDGNDKPAIDYVKHTETGGGELLKMAEPVIVPLDKLDQGNDVVQSRHTTDQDVTGWPVDITMSPVGMDDVDVMSFSTTDADDLSPQSEETSKQVKETLSDSGFRPYDGDAELGDISQGVSEFVAAPTEIPESEAVEDVMQLGEVGEQPSGDPDFDLMPEVTVPKVDAGTPFGGLPDAMPAGPMLGNDMGGEAAPAHIPNEEMIERLDGAATSMSDYMESNTQILEGLANAIQALMVRMRNVESQIERF